MPGNTFDSSIDPAVLQLNLWGTGAAQNDTACSRPPPPPSCKPRSLDLPPRAEAGTTSGTAVGTMVPVATRVRYAVACSHAFVGSLVVVALIPACRTYVSAALLLLPCTWLVPAIYHLALVHEPDARCSLLCGFAYIALLPAWLVQISNQGDELVFAALTVTSAISFYSMASDYVAVLICIAGAATLAVTGAVDASHTHTLYVMQTLFACTLFSVAVYVPYYHVSGRLLDMLV